MDNITEYNFPTVGIKYGHAHYVAFFACDYDYICNNTSGRMGLNRKSYAINNIYIYMNILGGADSKKKDRAKKN